MSKQAKSCKHWNSFDRHCIGQGSYRIKLPRTWRIHPTFHASLLLPYRETEAHGPNYTQPPPEIIENAEEWEVEEICGIRRFGPHWNWQYLIKWKGYPESDNTWEPIRNLKHANDAILEYHKQNPTKQRPKQFQG
jgi:hypothetical protein